MNPQPTFQLPAAIATGAAEVDWLYNVILWFSVAFTVLITGLTLYFIIRYRRRPGVAAVPTGHHPKLEFAWTVVPFFIIAVLFHLGFRAYVHNAVAAEGAMEIRVRGKKWLWEFEYANGFRENGTLRVPVNKPIKLILSSEDVIHSFYIPGARMKKDAVPGMYTSLYFEPNQLGDTQVFCAEYCGTSHSGMLATLKVVTAEEFDKFLKEGVGPKPGQSPEEWGAELFVQNACVTCHSRDGSKIVGPSFKGAWHRNEQLTDGSSVVVDENYVRESILRPQAKIVAGFTNAAMPPFVLQDKQIDALIAYIKSLK